jgi:para-nitrobenzyl esterase
VPTILGTNKDETKLFLYFSPAYPDKDGELYQTVTKYSSDFWKVDGADGLARKMSSHSDQPDVYVYQFLWGSVRDTGESVVPDPFGSHIGAMHGLEISFFLGNEVGLEDKLAPAGIILKTEQNRPGREALSEAMMAYVAQFVRTGNPNQPGAGLPEWTHWSNNEDESKCILFDADYDAIDIEMSMTEVTEEGLLAEIDMLPEELAEAVLNYLGR